MTVNLDTTTMQGLLEPFGRQIQADLDLWLIEPGTPQTLARAMRFCVEGGGKRLRPALVYLAAESVGATELSELTRRSAVAVELIHSYSLVHDDLPGMDNDTLRRGRPTAHVEFGEAMAILAGDALLTRAFGVLAEAEGKKTISLLAELAGAGGSAGMIAGQVADMDLCELPDGPEGMRFIHAHKTADLIRCAVRMGVISADGTDRQLSAVDEYGKSLGLAFQALDDVLDATGDVKRIGKTPGKDANTKRHSAVACLGLDRANKLVEELTEKAVAALEPLGQSAKPLGRLALLLGRRDH